MIKNKHTFLSTIVILITCLSCSSDDDYEETAIESTDNFYIESYYGTYAQYRDNLYPSLNYSSMVTFEYDASNRITKRNGDVFYLTPVTGGGGYMEDFLYTDLVYTNNKIHLEKKVTPNSGLPFPEIEIVPENETIIELDANNRMIKKIKFDESDYPIRDTTSYTYSNGKLMSFVKTSYKEASNPDLSVRYYQESTLYYTNDNLDSIVTIFSAKDKIIPFHILVKKKTKHFSNYDSAQNPFRKLHIFEETFNRSLSKNNFTYFKETTSSYNYPNDDYYQTPSLGPTQDLIYITWNLVYDENGEWIYDHQF